VLKNFVEIVFAIFKHVIFDSIAYEFSNNTVYLVSFYIGFLLSWYIFGFCLKN